MTKHSRNAFARARVGLFLFMILTHFGVNLYAHWGTKRG
jgi:hypothetical protein